MTNERRTLILGAMGALVSGATAKAALLLTPDQAMARYRDAVTGQYRLIEANKVMREAAAIQGGQFTHGGHFATSTDPIVQKLYFDWLEQGDDFLTKIMADFDGDLSDPQVVVECSAIFDGRFSGLNTLDVDDLMKITDRLVPIVIVKNGIQVFKLPFNTQRQQVFSKFAVKYKDTILGITRPVAEAA